MPAVTARKEVQGPAAVGPTCFKRLMAGAGSLTSTLAVDVLPVPPLVELTVTELVLRPVVVPCTLSVMVQDAPANKLAPLRLTVEEPAVAVAVPPQVFDKPLGVATTKPLGRESVKLTPVNVTRVLGLLMENVRLVVLPVRMELAPKDLAITGGATTVSEEVPYPVEVVLGPVSVEVMASLIFVYCPATFPNTLTEIVQDALARRLPPLQLIVEEPAVAVTVPLQVVDKPLGVAITNPLGRVSENETPLNALPVLGLAMLKVSVLVLPWAIDAGEKLLESVGTRGRGQPVMVMSSRYIVPVVTEGLPPYCAPAANTLKYTVVLPVLVVVAVIPLACHELALFHAPEFWAVQVVPSVLKRTYQLPAFDQLPCKL